MALPQHMLRLFKIPISWEQCTAEADGEKTYAAARTVMSRIDPAGSSPESFADGMPRRMIFMRAVATDGQAAAITDRDRITLPSGQPPPLQAPVKYVNPFYDNANALSHYEVFA